MGCPFNKVQYIFFLIRLAGSRGSFCHTQSLLLRSSNSLKLTAMYGCWTFLTMVYLYSPFVFMFSADVITLSVYWVFFLYDTLVYLQVCTYKRCICLLMYQASLKTHFAKRIGHQCILLCTVYKCSTLWFNILSHIYKFSIINVQYRRELQFLCGRGVK